MKLLIKVLVLTVMLEAASLVFAEELLVTMLIITTIAMAMVSMFMEQRAPAREVRGEWNLRFRPHRIRISMGRADRKPALTSPHAHAETAD